MMATSTQRLRLAGLLILAAILGTGCSLIQVPLYLLCGEAKVEPGLMKLTGDDKRKEAKVVILAYCPPETRPEFIHVDHDLSNLLTGHLLKKCKENKEKVEIVPPTKVKKFKDNHPDWHAMELADIGKEFNADYLIYLEVEAISLYEERSANQLYRGRASISVTLVDTDKPDEEPITRNYEAIYPSNARGAVPADDRDPRGFRQAFLDHVAKHLTWYFTAHSMSDEQQCE